MNRPSADGGSGTDTPIADDLADGPSASRYAPSRDGAMMSATLGDQLDAQEAGAVTAEMQDLAPEDEPFSAQLARAAARPRPRSATQSEGAITAEALDWLNGLAWTKARKIHQGAMTGGGEPDIDGCTHGRSFKIEMKRPGETPTARQIRRMQEWQRAGALVGWAESLADVQELLLHAPNLEWINPLTGPGGPVSPHD